MFNRRTFLKTGPLRPAPSFLYLPLWGALAAASPLAAETANTGSARVNLAALPARMAPIDPAKEPQQRIRRVAQTNMTEHDPAVMNVEEWADYRHSAQADIVFVSVTGILAFYPSKVKFHRHGKFLKDRDFFGECVAAARKRGMRVVARMSPDLNWGDALEARPEWFMRNRDGPLQTDARSRRCSSRHACASRYMDDYVPAIIREINSLYDVDCFYTNGWPAELGTLPECHSKICSQAPRTRHGCLLARLYRPRRGNCGRRYDAIAKEKKPESFFFANSQVATCVAARTLTGWARLLRGSRWTTRGRTNGESGSVGMFAAGAGVQRHHGWQVCNQRYGGVLDRRRAVAERFEESRRKPRCFFG